MDVDHIFYDGSICLGSLLAMTGAALQAAIELSKSRGYEYVASILDPTGEGRDWIPVERKRWLAEAKWKTWAWGVVWLGTFCLALGSIHPFQHLARTVLTTAFVVVALVELVISWVFTRQTTASGRTLARLDYQTHDTDSAQRGSTSISARTRAQRG